MDQPSDHVVTIPDASSIKFSNAIRSQDGSSMSVAPHEDVPTDVPTSLANNTHSQRHTPPLPRRRRCLGLWIWLAIDFGITITQIILVAVSLFHVPSGQHLPTALQAWIMGYGLGCILKLALLAGRYQHSQALANLLPQAVSISPDSQVRQSPQIRGHERCGKILKWLKRALDCFFIIWLGVGFGAVRAASLHRLFTVLIVVIFFCHILPNILNLLTHLMKRLLFRGANANVISALPTYNFNAGQVSSDGEINQNLTAEVGECCCICLDPYRDGVELKELPCAHHFHVKCIDRWLAIDASCPLCKMEICKSTVK